MLKIGEFSRLSRISVRMLRHYDEIGLLAPDTVDPETGYRYYSEEQLAAASRITALREMDFSLAAIGEMLRSGERETVDSFYCERLRTLTEQMQAIHQRIALVKSARKRLRKDEKAMEYQVNLKTIPERYAACVRMTLPRYDAEGMLWSTLMSETARMNFVADDPCLCCAVFHDGEYKEEDVDVEVQKTVKGHYEDTEHVRFKTLPAVQVASVVHKGSYSTLGAAQAALAAWVRDNGYAYAAPSFSIYHVSPHETRDPDAFVTELCTPVVNN